MAKMFLALAVATLIGFTANADDIKLTGENTKIEFTGTKKDGKHVGGFKKLSGTAHGPAAELKLELTIEVDSLFSDDEKLTGHLKSPDFFNVKEHAKAMFKITKTEKADKGFTHTGDLTMLGKTKPVTFTSDTKADAGALMLNSEFKIKRSDWGMTYGTGKVDDDVALKISVDTSKK